MSRIGFHTKSPRSEYIKYKLNTDKEGFLSYKDPKDTQHSRSLYDRSPDFSGI